MFMTEQDGVLLCTEATAIGTIEVTIANFRTIRQVLDAGDVNTDT